MKQTAYNKTRAVSLGFTLAGCAGWFYAQAQTSVNCWTPDGTEPCTSEYTSGGITCRLVVPPENQRKPKVKNEETSSGYRLWRYVSPGEQNNCFYRCSDGTSGYKPNQQGIVPDAKSDKCIP